MAETEEVKLLFFGTFFHENTEMTADLIQLKQNARLMEIRVIPLGATVDLSTGAFQLGATNPSEFDVEFYYNDLQVPSKSTFELLKVFNFNDKAKIQLVCDMGEEIITDGLLVRGMYSAVTLAVYGYPVKEVRVKEVPVIEPDSPSRTAVSVDNVGTASPIRIDSPDLISESDRLQSETEEQRKTDNEAKSSILPLEVRDTEEVSPSTTPSSVAHAATVKNTANEDDSVIGALDEDNVSLASAGDAGESAQERKETPEAKAVTSNMNTEAVHSVTEIMDTEEISDGEVFPSDDEMEDSLQEAEVTNKDIEKPVIDSSKIIVEAIEEAESISSPPQDQGSDVGSSLNDGYQEAGFEEIISDEEIDFPDYDDGDWEENWAPKFFPGFNPFSESFEIAKLTNITLEHGMIASRQSANDCLSQLRTACRRWPPEMRPTELSDTWVEDMEKLIPVIPLALSCSNESEHTELISALMFWISCGTNFSLAMEQPLLPFKTRHLKIGIKLIQCVEQLNDTVSKFVRLLPEQEMHQRKLMDLLAKPYMSNSCRLLILRTLDATVSSKLGFHRFVEYRSVDAKSCYQRLIECSLEPSFSTRMSFSLRSLTNKIHLMEGLAKLHAAVTSRRRRQDDASLDAELVIFEELNTMADFVDQYFAHPLRILPSSSTVELPAMKYYGYNPQKSFVRMLKEFQFLQLACFLINSRTSVSSRFAIDPLIRLITTLLRWESGVLYLCNESSSTTVLIRSLLRGDDELVNVGLLLAHSVEVVSCVDWLSSPSFFSKEPDDVGRLLTVTSFLNNTVGQKSLLRTLSVGDYIVPFIKCVDLASYSRHFSDDGKATLRGYCLDILDFVVRQSDSSEFFEKHGPRIFNLTASDDANNEGHSKLMNLQPFVKPTVHSKVFSLEGIDGVCETIKMKKNDILRSRDVESNYGFAPELTTCFRVLKDMCISPDDNTFAKSISLQSDELRIRQLKFDLAITKLHHLEMLPTMMAIVQKIVEDFSQPNLHTYFYVSRAGEAMVELLLPLVKVFRKCLTQVIHARKTDFRDTTAVPVLLKLYKLMDCFPPTSPYIAKAQVVMQNIVGTLLAYTIPTVKIGSETEDELNKSTWTAAIAEIIKFVLEEPSNFVSGLTLFSEMLPLPFPIASRHELSSEVCSEAIKLRRVWSAYIHGLSNQLQEMIGILCSTANNKLLSLVKRICMQLADLSSSTCLVVCRAILDAFISSLEADSEQPVQECTTVALPSTSVKAWVDTSKIENERQCSAHCARILGFLGSLMNNCPTIKCGLMQALKGSTKVDEKYCDVLTLMANILSSSAPQVGLSSAHTQAQDNVVTIFQSFCDVEINMLVPMFGKSSKTVEPEFVVANSLLQKDHLILILTALLKHLGCIEAKSLTTQVVDGVLRTVEVIAETDYGFSLLRTYLGKSPGIFRRIVSSLVSCMSSNGSDSFEATFPCVMSSLDLLKSVTTPRPHQMGNFPPRLSALSSFEFQQLFTCEDDKTIGEKSPLLQLQDVFKTHLENMRECSVSFNNIEATDVEAGISLVDCLVSKITNCNDTEDTSKPVDFKLPPPESLLELFNSRPIYVLVDDNASETLPIYWLTSIPPSFETDLDEEDSELVPCDLEQLTKSYLNGVDIQQEIQNMTKLSDPQSKEIQKTNSLTSNGANDFSPKSLQHTMLHRRSPFGSPMRGGRGMFTRGMGGPGRAYDPFRSRPPNTSRPPSLHVDDFVALESGPAARNDPYGSRGRGSRGSPNPYSNDRRRPLVARPGPLVSPYYGKRHEQPGSPSMRPTRGGRIFSTPNSDRWTADRASQSASPYERNSRPSPYDDGKYRSSPGPGGGSRGGTSSSRSQPYPQRSTGYNRDARPSPAGSYPGRWKERQANRYNRQ